MDSIYDQAVAIFSDRQYTWNINGERRVPSKEDIKAAVLEMQRRLEECEDGSTFTMGHLLVQKTEGHYDVYLRLGDLDEVVLI